MNLVRISLRGARHTDEYCTRCEARIEERWAPAERLCAGCALGDELFDPELRRARASGENPRTTTQHGAHFREILIGQTV